MANPAGPQEFPEHNLVLKAPPGMGDACEDLAVHAYPEIEMPGQPNQPGGFISRWEFTDEERAAIAAGGPIWVFVIGNREAPPPIGLTALDPFAVEDAETAGTGAGEG
jgi:hypothetical protein